MLSQEQQDRLAEFSPPLTSAELLMRQHAADVEQWQKESFPVDPVLLLELNVVYIDGRTEMHYAVPGDDMRNPETAQELVFFDIINGDGLVESAFINCSLVIRKVVFCNFGELHGTSLLVFDREYNAPRATKVLLGLPGIAKRS